MQCAREWEDNGSCGQAALLEGCNAVDGEVGEPWHPVLDVKLKVQKCDA